MAIHCQRQQQDKTNIPAVTNQLANAWSAEICTRIKRLQQETMQPIMKLGFYQLREILIKKFANKNI
jgi:hypothetical protein